MRILHVTTFLQGGAGRAIAALAIEARRAGDDPVVVADAGVEQGYATYPEYVEALRAAGIPFHTITSTFKRDLALNVRASGELRERLNAWHPDVVHAHAAIAGLVARLALRAPVVHTMHGWGIAKTAEHTHTDVTLLNLADAVITPSAAARRTLLDAGVRSRVRIVPYGIDPDVPEPRVDPDDRSLFERIRAEGAHIVLCTGTVGERKRQSLLVEALAESPDTHAIFVGEGDLDGLRAAARRFDVAARAHVLGYRPHASRYLEHADALVLPSMNEGLPLVLLEAFRAGTPVVGTSIPEIAEAIEDGRTGFLFEPESAPALASAIRQALAARSAELSEERRTVFRARYTLARMVSAYREEYDAVARRAERPARPEVTEPGEASRAQSPTSASWRGPEH